MIDYKLTDKVVVVTGGFSGIGKETALAFINQGAKVIVGDYNPQVVDLYSGTDAMGVVVDITNETSVEDFFKVCDEKYGRLDVIFHAAGGSRRSHLIVATRTHLKELSDFTDIVELNLIGSFLIAKYGLQLMLKSGNGGSIIFVSSTVARKTTPGKIEYGASKAGVSSLTECIALEYAKDNIRVNDILPGFVPGTNFYQGYKKEVLDVYTTYSPLGVAGETIDIANMALYLASEQAKYITGAHFVVDGGQLAGESPKVKFAGE